MITENRYKAAEIDIEHQAGSTGHLHITFPEMIDITHAELNLIVKTRGGNVIFEKEDSAFERDGQETQVFLEKEDTLDYRGSHVYEVLARWDNDPTRRYTIIKGRFIVDQTITPKKDE